MGGDGIGVPRGGLPSATLLPRGCGSFSAYKYMVISAMRSCAEYYG